MPLTAPAGVRHDLALAVAAVRRAAAAVAAQYRQAGEVRYKDPDQPVTAADLAADALLREGLLHSRPGYGWLSEESAAVPAAEGRTWVVDPIDGTSSFVAGIPEFGVSVALVEGGTPLLGVVANPVSGELYTAVAGAGAFLDGSPLRLGTAPLGTHPTLLVSRSEQARGLLGRFARWEQRPCGSTAIKVCRVAAGRADGYVSFGPKHAWDVCAPALVLQEAGGIASALDGAVFGCAAAPGAARGLVAGRPAAHAALMALVAGA